MIVSGLLRRCGDQLDDYLACIDGVDICNEDAIEQACSDEAFALFGCGEEGDDDPPTPG